MDEQVHCWSCGAPLELDLDEPVGRSTTCDLCDADVRACRGCVYYDPVRDNACREPSAERVLDKERANFCGFFRPGRGGQGVAVDAVADEAKRRLEALFGKR
ncbi:MAG: hypothetical protein EP329_21165 [Deltaproteobacteria bacterium]|nr:MAG: hypothetical protein EP329_21165 [Deltaproteobacteria bacterium]